MSASFYSGAIVVAADDEEEVVVSNETDGAKWKAKPGFPGFQLR